MDAAVGVEAVADEGTRRAALRDARSGWARPRCGTDPGRLAHILDEHVELCHRPDAGDGAAFVETFTHHLAVTRAALGRT